MITINGVYLDETLDLDYNLEVLRSELKDRYSFNRQYERGLNRVKQSLPSDDANPFVKVLFSLALFPYYILYLFSKRKIETVIQNAEDELIAYYNQPETKVKRSKLQCAREKRHYAGELAVIDREIGLQQLNLSSNALGENIKKEVETVIAQLEAQKKLKQERYQFYVTFEKKLDQIEEQLNVKRSLERTREQLRRIEERPHEDQRLSEMQEEFKLYDYYGSILDEISTNLKKLEAEESGKEEELVLHELLSQLDDER